MRVCDRNQISPGKEEAAWPSGQVAGSGTQIPGFSSRPDDRMDSQRGEHKFIFNSQYFVSVFTVPSISTAALNALALE